MSARCSSQGGFPTAVVTTIESSQHVAVVELFELGAALLSTGFCKRDEARILRTQATRTLGAAEFGEQHRERVLALLNMNIGPYLSSPDCRCVLPALISQR